MNKKKEEKLDEILYDSLSPIYEPAQELNRQILEGRPKEAIIMKHPRFTKTAAAAAIACIIAVGGTAYAAYRYLSPSQVAEQVSDNNALADAFQSSSAIASDEAQTSNGYDIRLLGLVSGSGLSPYVDEGQVDGLKDRQTYAALAISRTDGTAIDPEDGGKCISPLINGVDWKTANNGTLDAGLHWFVEEGVLYELLECDDLEIFAGRGVQIGVVENFGDETSAFSMDADTGIYKKNESYTGTCALFDLPLDRSKADEKAADAYIRDLLSGAKEEDTSGASEEEETPEEKAGREFSERLAGSGDEAAFLEKNAKPVAGSKKTLEMDAEGLVDFYLKADDGEDSGTVYVKDLKTDVPKPLCITGSTLEDMVIHMFTLHKDGSVTYEAYTPAIK